METMIDLHNHILYGLDDGAADLDESLEIARQLVSEGVERVAATPHISPEGDDRPSAELLRRRIAEVQTALDANGVPLAIVPGNELYLTPDAPALVTSGAVCRLGDGPSVLVELSLVMGQRPLYLDDVVFRLQLAGCGVVLAHPERYGFVEHDPHALDSLLERGLLLQLTAPALLGEYGPAIRRTAERLLLRGCYSLASSDRHHPGPNRSLAALRQRIEALTGRATADLLLRENPARVLEGKEVVLAEPVAPKQRTFFDRLLRREA
jgi:protein-tyrosine phosphatase